MPRLGVFCLPMPSHVRLFTSLARACAKRGHAITFFGISEIEHQVRLAGFDFVALEPNARLGAMLREMGNSGRLKGARLSKHIDELRYEAILQNGPQLVCEAGIDALLVDQGEPCSGTVAQIANVPWVSISSGLTMHSDFTSPPVVTSWPYSQAALARMRNRAAYAVIHVAVRSVQNLINRHRGRWGLTPLRRIDDSFSPYAQISQLPQSFEFPRRDLPACFHYVGPMALESCPDSDFPWHRLDGRPLVYACFGTMIQQRQLQRAVLDACANLPVQVVLSLGGAQDELLNTPENAIVVPFAPQLDVLRRAALCVTHGGLNTVLESLSCGVPVLALPINFDQPGVAARLRWNACGDSISPRKATAKRLQSRIGAMLNDERMRSGALRMQAEIAACGGAAKAADIIDSVVSSRKSAATPNLREA